MSSNSNSSWEDKLNNWRSSGLSIKAWCRKNNVADHLFHYWKRKLQKKNPDTTASNSTFIELRDPQNTPCIEIEFQQCVIRLHNNFNSQTFKRCMLLLKELQC